MRVLVTGGAGFIGSHLAEALLRRGDEVVVLDDLSAGNLRNLQVVEDRVGYRFVNGSVLDKPLVETMVKQVDAVMHLAGAVGVMKVMAHPYDSLFVNVQGTENVLSAAARYARRIIIASTSEVYGKNTLVPLHEDSDRVLSSTTITRWSYSTGKALDESLAFASAAERGLAVSVVRFFNTVGPRQSAAYGMVLPRFVKQALKNEDLTVFGDGLQTRCFGYVSDVIKGLLAILDRPETAGDVFNLGSDEEINIIELAQRVIELSGSSSGVQFVNYDDAYGPGYEDVFRRVPDIGKARRVLDYDPQWAIDDIVRAVIADQLGQPLPLVQGRREAIAPVIPLRAVERTSEVASIVAHPVPEIFADEPVEHVSQAEQTAPLVSIVVPVYNEARSVAETVRRIRSQPIEMQLVVVDDGSTDGTYDALQEVHGLIDVLIRFPENRGKGSALRAGLEATVGEVILFQDADLELDPADIPPLAAPILAGEVDAVYGTRVHQGNRRFFSFRQWWGNRMLSGACNMLYRQGITDVETAAKAFHARYAKPMELRAERFEIEPEIVAKLARMGAKSIEIPIAFRPRRRQDGKKLKMRDGIGALRTLVRFKLWRPDYRELQDAKPRTLHGVHLSDATPPLAAMSEVAPPPLTVIAPSLTPGGQAAPPPLPPVWSPPVRPAAMLSVDATSSNVIARQGGPR